MPSVRIQEKGFWWHKAEGHLFKVRCRANLSSLLVDWNEKRLPTKKIGTERDLGVNGNGDRCSCSTWSNESLVHSTSGWIVIISVLFNWTWNQTVARTTFPPSKEKTFVSNMFNTAWQRENSLLTQHSRDDFILCLPLNTFAIDLSANRMMHDVFELFNQFVASLFLTQSIPADFQITLDVMREIDRILSQLCKNRLRATTPFGWHGTLQHVERRMLTWIWPDWSIFH